MKLQMVGCSHHRSSVEVRERLAFSPGQTVEALRQWRDSYPGVEAVLLSTCNRTELYTASLDTAPSHHEIAEFIASFHDLSLRDVFDEMFEQNDEGAVRHLFTVAASLDSMVLGEAQILGQVKEAYELANQGQSTGPITHDVFQAALRVAKRVASETAINRRRVSIPSIAVADFAGNIFDSFTDKKVLLIGAGEMAEETLRYLVDGGAKDIIVINRSYDRAKDLAEKWNGSADTWEMLEPAIICADLIISTTGASEPIYTIANYKQIESQRHQRPLFILDLAIPRDFDARIGDCLGVYLYSIDDLRSACLANRKEREKEWPAAERIIDEETTRFFADLQKHLAGPTIRLLHEQCSRLKEEELERLFKKLSDVDHRALDEVRQSFDRLVKKMLHPPLESLRTESRNGAPHSLLDALKRLFQLKD